MDVNLRSAGLSSSPEAHRFSQDEVPPGYWVRNSNSLRPLTPLYADFRVSRYLPEAARAVADEFSLLEPAREWIIVDGFVYEGSCNPSNAPSAERVAAFEEKIRNRHEATVIARWLWLRPRISRALLNLQKRSLKAMSDGELLHHLGNLDDKLTNWYSIHFKNERAAPLVIGRCALFCHERFGMSREDFFELLKGRFPASREPRHELLKAAKRALRQPEVLAVIDSNTTWESDAIQKLLARYISHFAHRSLQFEFAHPTLAEQPEQIMELFREAVQEVSANARRQPYLGRRVERRWREKLASAEARERFDGLLRAAREAYDIRGDDIGFCLWGEGLMRYGLSELGKRLSDKGALDEARQVFYLRRSELREAFTDPLPAGLREAANLREKEREQQAKVALPDSFGTPPPPERISLSFEAKEAQRAMHWMAVLMSPTIATPASAD